MDAFGIPPRRGDCLTVAGGAVDRAEGGLAAAEAAEERGDGVERWMGVLSPGVRVGEGL